MSNSLDELYELAQGFFDTYSERNKLFKSMDDMYYQRWSIKDFGLPDWVLNVVSTDPHDSVQTAVRTFASHQPRFKVMPITNVEDDRDRANKIETALAYNFNRAGRRNDNSVVWDVMMSAVLYGEVAAQVIYLPYQEKILKAMGKNTKRVEAAKRFGDFAFIVHNPANIYAEWSEYGLEGVMTVRVQTVDEFVDTWGERSKVVFKDIGNGYSEATEEGYDYGNATYVTSYDYIDYEKRCVWGVMNDNATVRITGTGVKVLEEENKMGFIPYAIRRWGNSLSADPRERILPLLQPVYDSGQWDMLNIFESMDSSLAMKRASRPEYAGEFPPGQAPVVDNTEPSGVLDLPLGTRNFTPLPAQSMDARVESQKQQFRSGIWQSTVARVLTTLETGNRESYSSFNQRLSAASNSLAPYKMLAENALSELAHQMLCWMKYYGKEYGTSVDLYGKYTDKTNIGQEVRIDSKTIDPDNLKIEVILTPDLPIDKLQQINGAVLLKNNFMVPEEELIEDIVGGDPVEMAKRRRLEEYKNAYIQLDLERMKQELQVEMQGKIMEMQAGIQQQVQQQQMQQDQAMQQEQMAREQEAANANAANGATPAMDNMAGMSPNMGGTPPVQMARGQK